MSDPLLQKTIESLEIGELQEEVAEATKPGNTLRNILIGSCALIGTYLFLKPTAKAATQPIRSKNLRRADMRLSKNFVLSEFLISSAMPELQEYELLDKELSNVTRVALVLQRLRDEHETPIFITSGGRPSTMVARSGKYKGLNMVQILAEKGYKPSLHSQHMDFSAADFTIQRKDLLVEIFQSIRVLYQTVPNIITQSILYIENGTPNFIHLGVKSDLENFSKIVGDNIFLLAKVTVVDDKKTTDFLDYSAENLQQLLRG